MVIFGKKGPTDHLSDLHSGAEMCKHVLNSSFYMQAPCCGIWVECTECHDERAPDHQFKFSRFMRMTCKVCRRRFDRNLELFSEKDKLCSFCSTPWNKPGVTPESKMFEECTQVLDQILQQALDAEGWYFNAFHSDEHHDPPSDK